MNKKERKEKYDRIVKALDLINRQTDELTNLIHSLPNQSIGDKEMQALLTLSDAQTKSTVLLWRLRDAIEYQNGIWVHDIKTEARAK